MTLYWGLKRESFDGLGHIMGVEIWTFTVFSYHMSEQICFKVVQV